jgi:hypothetical protein
MPVMAPPTVTNLKAGLHWQSLVPYDQGDRRCIAGSESQQAWAAGRGEFCFLGDHCRMGLQEVYDITPLVAACRDATASSIRVLCARLPNIALENQHRKFHL